MPKQQVTIEVDVPEGYEVTKAYKGGSTTKQGVLTEVRYALVVEKGWQWPEWTNLNWLAMDKCGAWSFYENEPSIEVGEDFWYSDEGCYIEINGGFNFTPPLCTDWRTSKRRRPM